MPLLKALLMVVTLLVVGHSFALVWYNKYRIQQMLCYLGLCRGRELEEADYVDLLDEYTSFLAYMSFFPYRKDYPGLYTNPAFAAFAQRSKRVMQYLALALGGGMLLLMLLSFFQE